MEACTAAQGGDGIGITLLVKDDGHYWVVQSSLTTPDLVHTVIAADLSRWAGKTVELRILVDCNGYAGGDTSTFSCMQLLDNNTPIKQFENLNYYNGGIKNGVILQDDLNALKTEMARPPLVDDYAQNVSTAQNWMDGKESTLFHQAGSTLDANGYDSAKGSGAEWILTQEQLETTYVVHPPWKLEGVLYADIPLDLTGLTNPTFSAEMMMVVPNAGVNGVTLLAEYTSGDKKYYKVLRSQYIPNDGQYHLVSGNLSEWTGKQIVLRILVD